MKAWITKHAMTGGIVEVDDAELCLQVRPQGDMIEAKSLGIHAYFHKPDWHASLTEAQQRANTMRERKIESLKKQIVRLEKMTF